MYHLYQRTPTSWELDIYDNDFDTAYVHFAGTVRKWIEDNKETFDDMVKYTIIHSEYIFDPNSVKKTKGVRWLFFRRKAKRERATPLISHQRRTRQGSSFGLEIHGGLTVWTNQALRHGRFEPYLTHL